MAMYLHDHACSWLYCTSIWFCLKCPGSNKSCGCERAPGTKFYDDFRNLRLVCSFKVFRIHGIKETDLKDKKPFPKVFKDLCTWIVATKKELSREEGIKYYPGIWFILLSLPPWIYSFPAVLVAHAANTVHYRVLFSELRRHKLDSSCPLKKHKVKFCDSYKHLYQVCALTLQLCGDHAVFFSIGQTATGPNAERTQSWLGFALQEILP